MALSLLIDKLVANVINTNIPRDSGGYRGGMRGMHPPTGTSVTYFT